MTESHSNVGKTFAIFVAFVLKVLKKAIVHNIRQENLHDSSKICETMKVFSRLTFTFYGV